MLLHSVPSLSSLKSLLRGCLSGLSITPPVSSTDEPLGDRLLCIFTGDLAGHGVFL